MVTFIRLPFLRCAPILAVAMHLVLPLEGTAAEKLWIGDGAGEWEEDENWENASRPIALDSVALIASSQDLVVTIEDSIQIGDLRLDSDPVTTRNVCLTIKRGGELSIVHNNLDLGYNVSEGQIVFRVEDGAAVTVFGYIGRALGGVNTLIDVAGSLNAGWIYNDGGNHLSINMQSSGQLIVSKTYNRIDERTEEGAGVIDQLERWEAEGKITDRGANSLDPRWGSTHGINVAYDEKTGETTITSFGGVNREQKTAMSK